MKDPLHLTFASVKAGSYLPGNTGPDGIHYDVHGNLWVGCAGLGGILEIDPRGAILGFVPMPNGDTATTNFAFGGPDNQYLYFEGANSGTVWRFKLVRLRTTQAISAIMSLASDLLPTDPEALRQFAAGLQTELARKEIEIAANAAEIHAKT